MITVENNSNETSAKLDSKASDQPHMSTHVPRRLLTDLAHVPRKVLRSRGGSLHKRLSLGGDGVQAGKVGQGGRVGRGFRAIVIWDRQKGGREIDG